MKQCNLNRWLAADRHHLSCEARTYSNHWKTAVAIAAAESYRASLEIEVSK